jgi:hypothetical protein
VAVALGLSGGSGGGATKTPSTGVLPALSASAPPLANAQLANCTKVLEHLPVALNGLKPRVVHTVPVTPFVVAWGDPAIVLRCGVDRPKDLKAGSDKNLIAGGELSGAYYDVTRHGDANVYTAVDRPAYVSITIPSKYQGADQLPALNRAIVAAMPRAVCSTDPREVDLTKLCTRRK